MILPEVHNREFMENLKGKLGYLVVNNDPKVDDNLPYPLEFMTSSEHRDEFIADVRFYTKDDMEELQDDLTEIIIENEVAPSNLTCFNGVLYSANEFPKEDAGLPEEPDIVMILSVNRLVVENDNDMSVVAVLDDYDSDEMIKYIVDIIDDENKNVGMRIDADDVFVFAGQEVSITCTI